MGDVLERRRAYFRERQASRRQELILKMGGKCSRCDATADLQFDHVDSATVTFRLSGWAFNLSWDRILAEAAKCQLLCPACHRIKSRENGETGGGQNRLDEADMPHGTPRRYSYLKCRCGWCCEAYRQYKRKLISIGTQVPREGG